MPLSFPVEKEGFVVAPFSPLCHPEFYPTEDHLNKIPANIITVNHNDFKFHIHSKVEYEDYVKRILVSLGGNEEHKVVASRRNIISWGSDPVSMFETLCAAYPDAFVFFLSLKGHGTWIGASPELLLEKRGDRLSTMSLAGTRLSDTVGPWDHKNIKEQRIVTEHIYRVFEKYLHGVVESPATTRKAGNIEHLMTTITGEGNSKTNILSLLEELSPTPALCGYPREKALETIYREEGNRRLYGGFCGPISENGDFRFNVVLRCAFLYPDGKAILFAGGGITSHSAPELEWEETERKLNTLRDALGKNF